MANTPRFGLTHFGLGVEGSLSADGGKFTGRDRRVIDRVLHALEIHDHSGGQRLEDPDDAPELALSTTGGLLPSGTTLYYRVSFIDRYGLETGASPVAEVTTEGAVGTPSPPSLNAEAGGALEPGLYWYGLTFHSEGNETQISPAQVANITTWNSVSVSYYDDVPAAVDEVSVWRQGPMDAGFTRLVTLPRPGSFTDFFLDDGSIASDPCACDPENLPPAENLTNATNSVTVSIPPASVQAASGVRRWRIYRSTTGDFDDASLVAEVVETAEESGGDLVNEYLDVGAEPMAGTPLEISQTLTPSSLIEAAGSGGTGHTFFSAPMVAGEGGVWRLMATVSGELETRPTGLSTNVDFPAIVLVDSLNAYWRVTVDGEGVLVTESVSDPGDDRVHEEGLHLITPDASVTWRLGVGADGALFTEGEPVPGTDLMYLRPVVQEPDPPSTGGVFFVFNGELRWKNADGVVTVLADRGV